MADYVFFRKSRNALSTFLHFVLNLLLGTGSILITTLSNSWLIGIILVLISKWRVFAVQPRYIFLNLKSNLVDFIVGFSFVFLAFYAGKEFAFIHIVLSALYSIWLIFIKPLSSEYGTLIQSLVAIIVGTTASILMVSSYNPIVLSLSVALIGYSASRHVLAQNGDKDLILMTFICSLIAAEITWFSRFWLITYNFTLFGSTFIIPQLSAILAIVFFMFYKVDSSLTKHDGKISPKEIYPPIIFGVAVIIILVLFFSRPAFNLY